MNAIITKIRTGKPPRKYYGEDAATVLQGVRQRTFERGKIDAQVLKLSAKLRKGERSK